MILNRKSFGTVSRIIQQQKNVPKEMIDSICAYISYHTNTTIDMKDSNSPYLHHEVCKKMNNGVITIKDNRLMHVSGSSYLFNQSTQHYNINSAIKRVRKKYCSDFLSHNKNNTRIPKLVEETSFAYNSNVMLPYTSVFFRPKHVYYSNTDYIDNIYGYLPTFNIDLAHKDSISPISYLRILHSSIIFAYNEVFAKFFMDKFQESSFDIEYHKIMFNSAQMRVSHYTGKPYASIILMFPINKIVKFGKFYFDRMTESLAANNTQMYKEHLAYMDQSMGQNIILKVNIFPFDRKIVVMDSAYNHNNLENSDKVHATAQYLSNKFITYECSYENSEDSISSALSSIVCDILYNTNEKFMSAKLLDMIKNKDEVLDYVKKHMVSKCIIHTFKDIQKNKQFKLMFNNLFNNLFVMLKNRDTGKKYGIIIGNDGETTRPIYSIYNLPYVKASYCNDSSNEENISAVHTKRSESITAKEKVRYSRTFPLAKNICHQLSKDLTKVFNEAILLSYPLINPDIYSPNKEIVDYVKRITSKRSIRILTSPVIESIDMPFNIVLYWTTNDTEKQCTYSKMNDLMTYYWSYGRRLGTISINENPEDFVKNIQLLDIYNKPNRHNMSRFISNYTEKVFVPFKNYLTNYVFPSKELKTLDLDKYVGIIDKYSTMTYFKEHNPFTSFVNLLISDAPQYTELANKYAGIYKKVHDSLIKDPKFLEEIEIAKQLQIEAKQAYIDNVRRPLELKTNETSLEECYNIESFITQAKYYTDCKILHVPFKGTFQQIDDDMSDDI